MSDEPPFVKSVKSVDLSPKISVIVPVYKTEKYLPECIESILAQTFPDFELILVDDGSPDNSGKICDDYATRDSRIRVFHKENGGVSSARNLGLDNARGEWIAFVDSDDTVGEKYLEHLWGGNADSAGPDARTLVVSGLVYLDETGSEVESLRFHAGTGPVCETFRNRELYRHGYPFAKLFRNRTLRDAHVRFDPEVSLAEDMLFMEDYLRVADSVTFRADFRDYRYYRFRPGSLSKRDEPFENALKLFLRSREKFDALCGASPLRKRECEALRWQFFRAISCLYQQPFLSRKTRFAGLRQAFETLRGNEFSAANLSLRKRIFLKKKFALFDAVMLVRCRLCHGKRGGGIN